MPRMPRITKETIRRLPDITIHGMASFRTHELESKRPYRGEGHYVGSVARTLSLKRFMQGLTHCLGLEVDAALTALKESGRSEDAPVILLYEGKPTDTRSSAVKGFHRCRFSTRKEERGLQTIIKLSPKEINSIISRVRRKAQASDFHEQQELIDTGISSLVSKWFVRKVVNHLVSRYGYGGKQK